MSEIHAVARVPLSALLLGLAGLVPFAAGAAALWIDIPMLPPDAGLKLVVTFGALILSFLGGIRWGVAMGPYAARRQAIDFLTSVLAALCGLAAVFMPPVPALTLLIAGFLMQGLWDVTSVESGRLPQWFGKLRMMLTAGAVTAMIAALVAVSI